MRRPPSLALALALVLVAGCATPAADVGPASAEGARPWEPLTEDAFAFGGFLTAKVPSFDGTLLHVDLQLPEGEGPFPVLVEYTPYSNTLSPGDEVWGSTHEAGIDATGTTDLAAMFVPKGYAVAVAHVRGSGQSGGCFVLGGPEEAKDGYAIVEWLANQSWSNGRVALMGTSYVGTTPISTAALAPPHLTTIVPVSAVTEWYRYYYENGEPRFFGELPTGVVYTDHPLWMGTGLVPKPRNPTGISTEQPECARQLAENAYLQDDYNDYWRARDYVKDVRNATAPMLYAHGFLDENTPTSLVTDFFEAYGGETRVWLQQHGHGVPGRFDAYREAVHRWLDHWMLDRDNGAMEMPPVVVQDDRGLYRVEATWPPREAGALLLHLGEGALLREPPAEGALSYGDGAVSHVKTPSAVPPVRLAHGGLLQFDTEPLAEAVHLSGAARVELVASSDRPDTQFAALLFDVDPEGNARFVTRGYLDARHRASLERGEDVVPGEEALYAFELHGRDHRLEKGHVLRLLVSSSDPYVLPDAPGATNTLRLGPQGSRLVVPTVDVSSRVFSEDAWRIGTPG